MALTDTAIRNAKPKDRPYKVADARGMFGCQSSQISVKFSPNSIKSIYLDISIVPLVDPAAPNRQGALR
jgi:hypothetical protein